MSKLQYFNYPGYGELANENGYHYSQAVRIGNEVKISGQGGWNADGTIPDSEEEQIALAFENVGKAMKDAGIAKPFESIYSIRSYHVGLHDELAHTMIKYSKQFFKTHKPIWTMVGVEKLALKGMKVEIEATAVVE